MVPFTGPVWLSLEEFLARKSAVQPTVASICSSKFHLTGTEYTVLYVPGFQGLPCSTMEASTSRGFTKGPETYTWPTQDPCPRGWGRWYIVCVCEVVCSGCEVVCSGV